MQNLLPIFFTLLLFIENSYTFLFQIKEGSVFPEGMLSLIPAIVATIIIWTSYILFRKKIVTQQVVVLIVGTLLIVLLEIYLPLSPLRVYREATGGRAALDAIQLSNISDEPLLSPLGNVIGITYHATLRSATDIKVFPSFSAAMAVNIPSGDHRNSVTIFDHGYGDTFVPKPEYDVNTTKYLFKAGVEYIMTTDLYPPFIHRDYFSSDINKPFCINLTSLGRISRDQAERLILESVQSAYTSEVSISTDSYVTLPRAVPYTTSRQYNIKDIYEGAKKAGMAECKTEG